MQLLLDTHVLLACIEKRLHYMPVQLSHAIQQPENAIWVSVLSIWEIAIKHRLGKLPISIALDKWPEAVRRLGIGLTPISTAHVLADIGPEPAHKDPFDRLLLGICAAENFRLLTVDKELVGHPLAWKPSFPT